MQRDRIFEHYQDLDLGYEARPSYWVEPRGDWGDGRIELVEIPTGDETNDNIVAYWTPKRRARARPEARLGLPHHRRDEGLRAPSGRHGLQHLADASPRAGLARGRARRARAASSSTSRGGELAYYLDGSREGADRAVASPTAASCAPGSCPTRRASGFRAGIDVAAGQGPVRRHARLPEERQPRADGDVDVSWKAE